jgi:hypothetical protein
MLEKKDFSAKVPKKLVKYPPKRKEKGTRCEVICPENKGGCGWLGHFMSTDDPSIPEEEKNQALCPKCGNFLVLYWGDHFSFSFKMGPRGFHETKCGQRRKRDMEWRNKTLAHTQWENVAPLAVQNPAKVRNPTPGGPFDPNSRFNKGKKKPPKILQ